MLLVFSISIPTLQRRMLRLLLAGSSHVRRMDYYLHQECQARGIVADVDVVCLPGGIISQLKSTLQRLNLHQYDHIIIIIIIGTNNIFHKDGTRNTDATDIMHQLTSLTDQLQCQTKASVQLTSLLPRTICTRLGRETLPISHFITYNKLCKYINRHISSSQVPPDVETW